MRWSREYGTVTEEAGKISNLIGYTAQGDELDRVGDLIGVERKNGELDEEYRSRIKEEMFDGSESFIKPTKQTTMNDTITVLLEQQETWTSTPAYEIVGKTRNDIKVVREETDDTNHYKEEPYHEGVYLVEVDSLAEIIDEYDGSFIVTGDGSYGEEMYGVDEHDYEVIIQNEGV